MAEVQFITTVTIPDELIDADGRLIGSEVFHSASHKPVYGATWGDGERESVQHYAASVLVAYVSSSYVGRVTAATKIRNARRARPRPSTEK